MKKIFLILSLVLAFMFQNCSKFETKRFSETQRSVSQVKLLNNDVENTSIENLQMRNEVDLLNYMVSSNIQGSIANTAFYRQESFEDGKYVISVTKFNDSKNIEVFTADDDFIYIRYESTPETYGGVKNSVRRFEGVNPNSYNDHSVDEAIGNKFMGAIWAKRFVSYRNEGRPILVAHSIDQYIYNTNTKSIQPGPSSNTSVPMYIWFEFKDINARVPFVAAQNQPDHKLVISQQWSRCNTEQYEYALGVGYVGWRSLVSLNPACRQSVDENQRQTQRIALRNYLSENGDVEDYVVVQGMALNDSIDVSSYHSRVEPSFYPSNIFLDDYPYLHSTRNNLLDSLRRPISTPKKDKAQKPVVKDNTKKPKKNKPHKPVAKDNTKEPKKDKPHKPAVKDNTKKPAADKTQKKAIQSLYLNILERPASKADIRHYLTLLKHGRSLNFIENEMLASRESKNLQQKKYHKELTDKIRALYLEVLNRKADAVGLQYYVDSVNKGSTLLQIKRTLLESNEYFVRGLYLKHLLREPDSPGMEFYKGLLRDGVKRSVVARDIRKSPECKASCL